MTTASSHDLEPGPIDDAYRLEGTRQDRVASWDKHVIVDVVHDGTRLPTELDTLFEQDGSVRAGVRDAYIRERDWGASAVADRLAYHLGLRGFHNVQAARVACDYNRFRGWSVPEAGHLGRRALFPPTSELLSPRMGELALKTCFDPVSDALYARCEEAFDGELVKDSRLTRITVHTYDEHAGEGHRRPKASLIFTPFEYHEFARLPASVYPPVFPDRLAEFTADRALAYRIALGLEKNYVPVAVNSPYFLPLGGAEMRLQVYCYMRHLQQLVERIADEQDAKRFEPLWPYLLDIDHPWVGRDIADDLFATLEELCAWVKTHHFEAVERYRYSAYRPNAIEVEIRKDLAYEGSWQTLSDGREAFVPEEGALRMDVIDRIAAIMATGVREYLTKDQPEKRAGARTQ